MSGIYARLTATAVRLDVETTRAPVGQAAAYADVSEFKADLDTLHRSLISNNSRVIARGRLRLLRRAVDCFGFHLARLDMRQNSAVHERTVAELIDRYNLTPAAILVEYNGVALHPRDWPQRNLTEGDRLEIVRVVAGG